MNWSLGGSSVSMCTLHCHSGLISPGILTTCAPMSSLGISQYFSTLLLGWKVVCGGFLLCLGGSITNRSFVMNAFSNVK